MKTFLCALGLVLSLGVTACDFQQAGDSSGSYSTVDSQHMQLATSTGYEIVSKYDVSSVEVRFFDTSEHKMFYGPNARMILGPIFLNAPRTDTTTTGDVTGEIVIQYQNRAQSEVKILYIVNNGSKAQFVEDSNYSQIHYPASKPLDSAWLGG